MTPQAALTMMRNQTRQFLERHVVVIGGNPNSGVVACRINDLGVQGQRPGRILRTKNMHNSDAFFLGPSNVVGGGAAFNAHWAKMEEWQTAQDLINIAPYQLDNTGPDLFLTVKLTGCSIGMTDTGGGGLQILHIRPSDEVNGVALQGTLQRTGGWTKVYGANSYGAGRAISVVGRRQGGAWKIYAQKQGTTDLAIHSVHRIWP